MKKKYNCDVEWNNIYGLRLYMNAANDRRLLDSCFKLKIEETVGDKIMELINSPDKEIYLMGLELLDPYVPKFFNNTNVRLMKLYRTEYNNLHITMRKDD